MKSLQHSTLQYCTLQHSTLQSAALCSLACIWSLGCRRMSSLSSEEFFKWKMMTLTSFFPASSSASKLGRGSSWRRTSKISHSPNVWRLSGLQGHEGIQHVDMGGMVRAVRPGPCPLSPLPRPRAGCRGRRGAGQLMRSVGRGTVGPRSRHHPHPHTNTARGHRWQQWSSAK